MAVALVVAAQDERLVAAYAQYVGIAAPLPYTTQMLHLALPVEAAYGIVGIVIAADDDAPVGQQGGSSQHAPTV